IQRGGSAAADRAAVRDAAVVPRRCRLVLCHVLRACARPRAARTADGSRRVLRRGRSIPAAAPWLDDACPVGDVQFMGRLANQLRRPAADGRSPIGLLGVGDAAVCTNPTWGRGAALALASAAALVDAVNECGAPSVVTRMHATWTAEQHEPWFHDTLLLDAETNAAWAGLPPTSCPARPFRHDAAALAARTDPGVGVAYLRYRNLLDQPDAFWGDLDIADQVRHVTAGHLTNSRPPSRQQFL